jgi:HEAT repeat protein
LNLGNRLRQVKAQSDSAAFFFGRRTQRDASDTSRPSAEFVRKNVIPALVATLEASQTDLRDSACIAIGKVGGVSEIPALVKMLDDRALTVRQGAAIGIGLIGAPEGIPPLLAVLEAGEQGNWLCGRRPGPRLRAQAAAALGLIGDHGRDTVKEALIRFSASTRVDRNVRVNATVGLGLLQGEHDYVRSVAEHLKRLAGNRNVSDFVRAHAIVALGRVLERNRIGADDEDFSFLMRLGRRTKSNHVLRSVVITLGGLVEDPEKRPDTIRWLRHVLARTKDGASRNFAAIALGEIGGEAALKTLSDVVIMNRNELKAFAGLGLGILCRATAGDRDQGAVDRLRALESLRVAFKKAKTPRLKAALGIGLGLARDAAAGPLLLKAMKRTADTDLKGHLAVALGLVNHRGAVDHLVSAMKHSGHVPILNQRIVIGLGLMGTRQVIKPLVEELNATRSVYTVASTTQALALIGDHRAVEPLTSMLMNPKVQTLTRAYACVALGCIGEESSPPVLAPVFKDHNYLASTLCLMELANIM